MLRLVEVGLLLAPVAFYGAALVAGYRISPPLAWTLIAVLTITAALTVWIGLEQGLSPNERYVPAHMENGRVVQGRGTPP